MTLKEKFENIIHNYIGSEWDRRDVSTNLVTDADEFAIEFHRWMLNNDTQENAEKWFHYADEDMLNAFKTEKGL